MAEETKFTDGELKQVKEIQDNYFDIQTQFGQLSVAKLRLDQQSDLLNGQEDELNKKFNEVQSNERELLNKITEKYGDGSLDPETGVFTSNKSE